MAVPTLPVALPVDSTTETNAVPAVPVNPDETAPAFPAVTYSAFAARDIAERSLDPALMSPTGRAELLRIIGKREPSTITPRTWTFYFFDKSAAGHGRIVTVTDGRVVKSGEDFVDSLTPYSEQVVLPEAGCKKIPRMSCKSPKA